MGSCLSSDSRSPLPGSPTTPTGLLLKDRQRSPDYPTDGLPLHKIPGRLYLNGSSDVASLYTLQGKKGVNQDAMLVWENFGSREDSIFCGVFDGHGPYGHLVARKVRDSLPHRLRSYCKTNADCEDVLREISINTRASMEIKDPSTVSTEEESRPLMEARDTEKQVETFQSLKSSFLRAFRVMDRELKAQNRIDCYCSGTTAVTVMKQGQYLAVGNVGDSRAVMGSRDKDGSLIAVQLTVDLKPNLPAEAERIRKCRGRVFALQDEPEVARVWLPHNDAPGLAMARAFGDFCLKNFGLISVPDVSFRSLSERDEFIVLATDGVWDVLSNEEVVETVALAPSRSVAARVLVNSAVRAWKIKYPTSKIDDCAVVCLFLDSFSDKCNQELGSGNQVDSSKDTTGEKDPKRPTKARAEDRKEGEEEEEEESKLQVDRDRESEIDWSALEGVSRLNTLMSLPKYKP
ncbi:hypothetical protein MLD38_017777 [Melastoma candidum]|uniref:Uncharacterized protein n=1 Tax=Melastoma candidum TaxID=119954 RepID=A0ACB9QRT9_9MYRT|nr:hypothetical protein MLD38_017777 [Melastoma candidum]